MKGVSLYTDDFLIIKVDNDLLKENITRILLTSKKERVFNPNFGSKLKEYIFNPDNVLQNDVIREISNAINRWEPRVEIKDIYADIVNVGEVEIKIALMNKITLEEFDYEQTIKY